MTYWAARFLFDWTIWIIFADKKRWREILPVCFFASWLSYIVESVMHYAVELWSFSHPQVLIPLMVNGFGIYIVVTYLFIQWLPKERTHFKLATYILLWSIVTISFEYIHLVTGNFVYHRWWNIGCSFLADLLLFVLFYLYYITFQVR